MSVVTLCRHAQAAHAVDGCVVCYKVRVNPNLDLKTPMSCVLCSCAGDFPGAGDAVHRSAAQQLQQQVSVATAPAIMALARQQDNKPLQDRCVEVMSAHRKNDVYGVLDFALRFGLRSLQGSCLGSIRRQSRDRLVDKADRIMQVRGRHLRPTPAVLRIA
jgi:hypothetical protein